MTVRGEIAKPRHETGARSPEDLRRTRAVRGGSEVRARRPPACRNTGSAIAAEELRIKQAMILEPLVAAIGQHTGHESA